MFRSKGSLFEGQSLLHIITMTIVLIAERVLNEGSIFMYDVHVGHVQECHIVRLRISISCNRSDYDVHMCMSLVSASRTTNKLQYVALSN